MTLRQIDREPHQVSGPLKIIVASLGRTGTNCKSGGKTAQKKATLMVIALYYALQQLGYRPFHGFEYPKNPRRHFALWAEALKCNKLGKGRPYGREEFEKLLGSYDAVLDFPQCLLWEDLYKAYPNAKVILTNRDSDAWLKSMKSTLFAMLQWKVWNVLKFLDWQETRPMMDMLYTGLDIFCGRDYGEGARRAYLDHHAYVRRSVPRENLLELNLGDGWEPLCEFLVASVPSTEYPRTNAAENWTEINRRESRKLLYKCLRRIFAIFMPVIILGAGIWYAWRDLETRP